MKLGPLERIVALAPEHHAGPGWRNATIRVVVADNLGNWREEHIQQADFTDEQHLLFDVAAAAYHALLRTIHKGDA